MLDSSRVLSGAPNLFEVCEGVGGCAEAKKLLGGVQPKLFEGSALRDISVDPVLASDPRWKGLNGPMFADLGLLGWFDGAVLDATYGFGGFWTHYRPEDLTTNDLSPNRETALSLDWVDPDFAELACLERVDGYDAVVFDPPYRLQGSTKNTKNNERYGIHVQRSMAEIVELIREGTRNTAACVGRGGRLMVKCQNQRSLFRYNDQIGLVSDVMDSVGAFNLESVMHLVGAKSGQPKKQTTPRNNLSHLLVFKKDE